MPLGRIIEVRLFLFRKQKMEFQIYGPEGCGKTTLALHLLAAFEKSGGKVALIDVENALAIDYSKVSFGVLLFVGIEILSMQQVGLSDEVCLIQPNSGDEAFDILVACVRSRAFKAILIDSVAALQPVAELEGEMEDQHV